MLSQDQIVDYTDLLLWIEMNSLLSLNLQSAIVFPNKISTEQQSLMLVKRLLAVAVSCITYLRGIFPESAYGTRYMDGNRLLE